MSIEKAINRAEQYLTNELRTCNETAEEAKGYNVSSFYAGFECAIRKLEQILAAELTTDVEEIMHGKWHIMSEDPYDETNCPKDEGWYRIITSDGEEMTDYYFNRPTLVGRGVVYWKNCTKSIRAWAKIEEKELTKNDC